MILSFTKFTYFQFVVVAVKISFDLVFLLTASRNILHFKFSTSTRNVSEWKKKHENSWLNYKCERSRSRTLFFSSSLLSAFSFIDKLIIFTLCSTHWIKAWERATSIPNQFNAIYWIKKIARKRTENRLKMLKKFWFKAFISKRFIRLEAIAKSIAIANEH